MLSLYYETSKPISVIAMCKYFLNYVIKQDLACKVHQSNSLIESSDLIVCCFRSFRAELHLFQSRSLRVLGPEARASPRAEHPREVSPKRGLASPSSTFMPDSQDFKRKRKNSCWVELFVIHSFYHDST